MVRAALATVARAAWTGLGVHPLELRLDNTLENGQCFGWRRQPGDEPVWLGVLGEHVLALRQTEDDCMFRCVGGPAVAAKDAAAAAAEEAAVVTQLRDYFQLDQPLRPLYAEWAAADHRMASVTGVVPGMRVLRQDPSECLFSFICSSNNNIGRIGGMLQSLRAMYGTPIPTVDAPVGAPGGSEADAGAAQYYTFPSVQALAAASDAELRSLGMGYRADYIRRSAQLVETRGVAWLWRMRAAAKEDVRRELCELPGVGPKVADCVALFSLDQAGTVPVDTHVRRRAAEPQSLRAAELQSCRAAELQSRRAAELQSLRAAEPQSCPAAELPGLLRALPEPRPSTSSLHLPTSPSTPQLQPPPPTLPPSTPTSTHPHTHPSPPTPSAPGVADRLP